LGTVGVDNLLLLQRKQPAGADQIESFYRRDAGRATAAPEKPFVMFLSLAFPWPPLEPKPVTFKEYYICLSCV